MKGTINRSEFVISSNTQGFTFSTALVNVKNIKRPVEMIMNIDGMLNYLVGELLIELENKNY